MHNREHPVGGCITAWYGNCTALNRKALQRVVRSAQRITRGKLPALQDTYSTRCHRKAIKFWAWASGSRALYCRVLGSEHPELFIAEFWGLSIQSSLLQSFGPEHQTAELFITEFCQWRGRFWIIFIHVVCAGWNTVRWDAIGNFCNKHLTFIVTPLQLQTATCYMLI
jgi:hypothetical protein